MSAAVPSKSSDQIINELLQTIHSIGSGTSDSSSSSSSDEESRKTRKKHKKKTKRDPDDSSESSPKHKRRKKRKKHVKKHSSHKKKSKKSHEERSRVKVKLEPIPPERVKQEPLESPLVKKEPESDHFEAQDNEESQLVADVFLEDLLDSGDKTVVDALIQPSNDDKAKTSIKITDLKKCHVLELAEVKAKEKAAKYEEGEITESCGDSSDDDLNSRLKKDSHRMSSKDPPNDRPEHYDGKNRESKRKSKKSKHKSSEKRSKNEKSSRKDLEVKTSRKRNREATSDDENPSKKRKTSRTKESKQKEAEDSTKRSPNSLSLSPSPEQKNVRSYTPPSRSSRRVSSKGDVMKDNEKSPNESDSERRKSKRDKSESRSEKKSIRETSPDKRKERRRSPSRRRDRRSSKRRSRSRSKSKDEFYIDKTKLLEIARKNALNMMKHGHVRNDLNKASITAGGKTVDELTDFCKLLSEKEARGQESVSSDSSENDEEKPFHHPFQLKERPNSIVMNIRNCNALPVKSHLEKTTENAQQLRLQFPVSSGQHHRKTESEWIPVEPKKPEAKKVKPVVSQPVSAYAHIPLPSVKPTPQPVPPVSNSAPSPVKYDIAANIAQKLEAIRRQQEVQAAAAQAAFHTMHCPPMMWNMDQVGLFTGSTGARVLTQAELASGQQAWAKRDQLMSAQPVSSGMGMSLLQKMGWNPGEGLGKNKEGTLEPLTLQVKMDKRGLVCAEEQREKRIRPVPPLNANIPPPPAIGGAVTTVFKAMENKHPVSLLVEYCTRRHYPPPVFDVFSEEGPPHKKSFIFKVTVNGVEFRPMMASPNKKLAKAEAATVCLRKLGILSGP